MPAEAKARDISHDDATIVIGAGAAAPAAADDATLVVGGALPAAPVAEDATAIVGASPPVPAQRAPAPSSRSDDTFTLSKRPNSSKPKRAPGSGGGFLGPVATELVARGVLPEREAISLALRARDHGHTFFYAMALDATLSADANIYSALAERLGTRFIGSRRELMEQVADVDWLDAKSAEQRGVLILQPEAGSKDESTLEYVALDPCDVLVRDWLKGRTGKTLKPVVVLPAVFFESVTSLKARIEAPKRGDESLVPIDVSWQQENLLLDQPLSADVPLVVDYILQKCQEQGASDIHLEPTEEGMLVRARVDGMLQEQSRMPLEMHSAVVSRIKVMAG